jgi:Cdc6-like AAA superfamily ATPase
VRVEVDDGAVVPDLAHVVSQQQARFAVEVAAAGAHHLMLTGPPGIGKTSTINRLRRRVHELDPSHAPKPQSLGLAKHRDILQAWRRVVSSRPILVPPQAKLVATPYPMRTAKLGLITSSINARRSSKGMNADFIALMVNRAKSLQP